MTFIKNLVYKNERIGIFKREIVSKFGHFFVTFFHQ